MEVGTLVLILLGVLSVLFLNNFVFRELPLKYDPNSKSWLPKKKKELFDRDPPTNEPNSDPQKSESSSKNDDSLMSGALSSALTKLRLSSSSLSRFTKFGLTELDYTHHVHPLDLPPKLCLVTDLDHTLVGVGESETRDEVNGYLHQFNRLWCSKYAPNQSVLVYATGRSFEKYAMLVEEYSHLLKPDVLICKDGVDIYWFNQHLAEVVEQADLAGSSADRDSSASIKTTKEESMQRHDWLRYDENWDSLLGEGWNQQFAEQLFREFKATTNLAPLPAGSEYVEHFRVACVLYTREEAQKCCRFFQSRVDEYNAGLPAGQPKMEIQVFHCIERAAGTWWAAFTPARAGKGCAVDFVRKRLRLEDGRRVVACGDSGNDITMLSLPDHHAVVVANCSKELTDFYEEHSELKGEYMYLSKMDRTRGVIEGLQYFADRIESEWPIKDTPEQTDQ